jgi:hypothetical protein
MRVQTGPGKVTTLPAVGGVLSASLHNFDIDDATVKPAHRSWLDAHAVPLLTSFPRAYISLRGSASHSGSAAYNRALSERRVDAVRDYLVRRGVQESQIDVTFTGQDLSVSLLSEDEADRAVFLRLTIPRPGNVRLEPVSPRTWNCGPRYSFLDAPVALFAQRLGAGVLATAGIVQIPDSLSVPTAGLGVLRAFEAAGYELEVEDPQIAQFFVSSGGPLVRSVTVRTDQEDFSVQGLRMGRTRIVAHLPGNQRIDDQCVVFHGMPRRVVTVAFHYRRDNPPDPDTQTNRNKGDEAAALGTMNNIFKIQANIEFQDASGSPHELPLDNTTPARVRLRVAPDSNGGIDWPIITGHRDGGAKMNVFFIRSIVLLDLGRQNDVVVAVTDTGGNRTGHRDTICRDDTLGKSLGRVLAHEAGHALGLGHSQRRGDLMFEQLSGQGLTISSDEALRMHFNLLFRP